MMTPISVQHYHIGIALRVLWPVFTAIHFSSLLSYALLSPHLSTLHPAIHAHMPWKLRMRCCESSCNTCNNGRSTLSMLNKHYTNLLRPSKWLPKLNAAIKTFDAPLTSYKCKDDLKDIAAAFMLDDIGIIPEILAQIQDYMEKHPSLVDNPCFAALYSTGCHARKCMVLPPLNLLPEARPEKAIGKSSVLIDPLLLSMVSVFAIS